MPEPASHGPKTILGLAALAACTVFAGPNEGVEEVNASKTPGPSPGTLVHHQDFPSTRVPSRHVEVWLPEGYDAASDERYPVIYMQDGQYKFSRGRSPLAGTDWSWDVDKTMTGLIREGEARPAIMVAVWTDGENKANRRAEYMPQKFLTDEVRQRMIRERPDLFDLEYTSDRYLGFLVEELKPFIDETYRTRPGPEDTFVMGSSLGGLISAYAIAEYPGVFGGAACLSPHWVIADGAFVYWLADHWPAAGSHRIYFDHGTETYDANYGPHQIKMDEVMRNKGFRAGDDWVTRRFEGADHSPSAWRERVDIPLKFLLGSPG